MKINSENIHDIIEATHQLIFATIMAFDEYKDRVGNASPLEVMEIEDQDWVLELKNSTRHVIKEIYDSDMFTFNSRGFTVKGDSNKVGETLTAVYMAALEQICDIYETPHKVEALKEKPPTEELLHILFKCPLQVKHIAPSSMSAMLDVYVQGLMAAQGLDDDTVVTHQTFSREG